MVCFNRNSVAVLIRLLLVFPILICLVTAGFAKEKIAKDEDIVGKFYRLNRQPLYWFSSEKNIEKATEWLTMILSARHLGIITDQNESDQICVALLSNNRLEEQIKEQRDRQITGWVLDFIKELHEGNIRFDYDEVNPSRDSLYIAQLIGSNTESPVSKIVSDLECKTYDYQLLKKFLSDSVSVTDTLKCRQVVRAMNYCRYFAALHLSEYIIANIPSAEVNYTRNDSLILNMRAVVGMKTNHSPTIASYITNIVTFPLWNVPHSISVKEILPKVQKNSDYLEKNDYEVVDNQGNVIDESGLIWKNYNKNNFPYLFRQATGPDNSLGVVKFNFRSPFSIYLHSTNAHAAFARERRFLSHGCIRLEKAFELAKDLAPQQIDIMELKSGKKNTKSKTIMLNKRIPVFIIYNPLKIKNDQVILLQDIYGLLLNSSF